jgi:hypothetical protein
MDNCAVGKDGKLLDASQIKWFRDADDAQPMPPASSDVSRAGMYEADWQNSYLNNNFRRFH